MVRFSSVLIVYFVIGAVMFGGGAIGYSDAEVVEEIVGDPDAEDGTIGDNNYISQLDSMAGPIGSIAAGAGAGLLAVWNVLSSFITFVFWPLSLLHEIGAPIQVTVLLGGTLSVAFIAGLLRTVRGTV